MFFTLSLGIVPSSLVTDKTSGATRTGMLSASYPVLIERLIPEVMNECERLFVELLDAIREPFATRVRLIGTLTA